MRINLLAVLALASACGDDTVATQRLDSGLVLPDATEFAPEITSFTATPSSLTSGVATMVTWNWTYLNDPTFPDPTCSIDNGVGPVTRGQMTSVTLTQVTTFRLTCTNTQGSAERVVVVSVPPVAPTITGFTATPSTLTAPNSATSVMFSWSYSNVPSPTPTCVIDGLSASPVTSGTSMSISLPQARTYRLRCTNTAGSTTSDVTVAVNECGNPANYFCNVNANCVESVNGYSCQCAGGFTGDGNTCNFNTANMSQCDTNATWNGTSCVCNVGYIGSGANNECIKARVAFVTSVTGTGQILNGTGGWAGGSGATGVLWADSICEANKGTLTGTFKAWISDANDDAYCRIAGYSGKKATNCGQGALPTAGPWLRTSSDRRPFAPTLDKLVAPTRAVYYPANYTSGGTLVNYLTKVWTGTTETGEYSGNVCNDVTNGNWASSGASTRGTTGLPHGGSTAWTKENGGTTLDTSCAQTGALLCMEVGSVPGSTGPALPPRHQPTAKKVFVTSVTGNAALAMWPDAHGVTGSYSYVSADEICRSRARYAGYLNANSFKSWFSVYPYSISSRYTFSSSPYARPDGVILANTRSQMTDSPVSGPALDAAWNLTELNTYEVGNVDTGVAWTGMTYSGSYYTSSSTSSCVHYTNGTNSYSGVIGRFGLTDDRVVGGSYNFGAQTQLCDQVARLYCAED